MYTHNHATGTHARATAQGYAPNPVHGTALGHVITPPSLHVPLPIPAQTRSRSHTPTPTAPVLNPVQVPPGCYPIELVQFWRAERRRDQPPCSFLHWALFVRTAPPTSIVSTTTTTSFMHGPGSGQGGPMHVRRYLPVPPTPRGNFYELVGTPATYTAQFLHSVTFEPERLADWRGTHVIGWVSPGQLHVFEKVVRQVQVWRHRSDWRSQQWAYDVVMAVRGNYQGLFMDGVTWGALQKHMGRLLEAWENGDI